MNKNNVIRVMFFDEENGWVMTDTTEKEEREEQEVLTVSEQNEQEGAPRNYA